MYCMHATCIQYVHKYRVVGMFGRINAWRITELKQKKFGEWIDFDHKDTIYKLKFG